MRRAQKACSPAAEMGFPSLSRQTGNPRLRQDDAALVIVVHDADRARSAELEIMLRDSKMFGVIGELVGREAIQAEL